MTGPGADDRHEQHQALHLCEAAGQSSGAGVGSDRCAVQMADLKRAGLPARQQDCERMVGMLDSSHQGGVSFQDFARFVALLPEAQVPHQATCGARRGSDPPGCIFGGS